MKEQIKSLFQELFILIFITILAFVSTAFLMCVGYLIMAMSAKDESMVYYTTSFATLFILVLICVLSACFMKFDKTDKSIIGFVRNNTVKIIILLTPWQITLCYLGWCFEIFTVGFGAARIFGFNPATTGTLFNLATVVGEIGFLLLINRFDRIKKRIKR